jgi:hypothetical protein
VPTSKTVTVLGVQQAGAARCLLEAPLPVWIGGEPGWENLEGDLVVDEPVRVGRLL